MSLLAHWRCQDNAASTVVAATVGSNATLQGGDNTSTISEVNGPGTALTRSLHLNGTDDWIQIADLSASLGTNASFCMWIRLDNATPGAAAQSGFLNLGASVVSGSSHWPYTDGTAYMSALRFSNNTTSNRIAFSPPGGVTRTNWHHIAITNVAGANGWKFYVNGDVATQNTGQTLFWDSDLWAVGRSWDTTASFYLDGRVCDIRVYDETLSEAAIEAIMAQKDLTPALLLSNAAYFAKQI